MLTAVDEDIVTEPSDEERARIANLLYKVPACSLLGRTTSRDWRQCWTSSSPGARRSRRCAPQRGASVTGQPSYMATSATV
jgi:hypothetical protein